MLETPEGIGVFRIYHKYVHGEGQDYYDYSDELPGKVITSCSKLKESWDRQRVSCDKRNRKVVGEKTWGQMTFAPGYSTSLIFSRYWRETGSFSAESFKLIR